MSGTSFRWIIGEKGRRKGYEQSGRSVDRQTN